MASTVVATSTNIPSFDVKDGASVQTRPRHFSLVDNNQRHLSRSSVSEEIVKPGVRTKSVSNARTKSVSSNIQVQDKPKKGQKVVQQSKIPKAKVEESKAKKKVPTRPINYSEIIRSREEVSDLPEGVINIDIEDGLYDYAADVIVYLSSLESEFKLKPDFLKGGSTTQHMRSMLVDWIVQVQHYLRLSQETLYLSIKMIDLVISKRDIPSDKLQLVGISCILIASKMEEYYPADIRKLISLTSDSYTKKQVLKMEIVIINVLNYQMYFPEIMPFLKRYTRAALRSNDDKFLETCQYLIDGNIVDDCFSTVSPGQQAAASILAANLLYSMSVNKFEEPTEEEVWSLTLRHYTKCHVKDIINIVHTMIKLQLVSEFTGAKTKYTSNSMHQRIALDRHLQADNLERALKWILKRS
eukprot:TRINITY_DN25654_c0_g1_i1.p1 TRINITY_DN25654_c0_g1~~TRINITY_DN25654_c0_g1_i1.p1  ORF type:complete len:413 (-),score=86.25 TRINITY_DN25654_c0_g1_i1:157-1395(-)